MSFNQIRPDRSDNNPSYRKSGRSSSFNHPRTPSASLSKPGPAGASTHSPANASNRSFKKNNNAQGGQPRAGVSDVNSSDSGHASIPRGLLNGAHLHPPSPGLPDAPVSSTVIKPTELPATQRSSTGSAPKPATLTSDTGSPITPTKASGDQLKGFSFQFGTISPVTLNKMPGNKMQIPARTSSAPPNLDEQKGDQARHQSFQTEPHQPTPLAPKQQLQRKDSKAVAQPGVAEAPPMPKPKVDVRASPSPPTNQSQKPSVISMSGIPMPKPFQQPQVPGSFAGPSQQIQSQAIAAASLHMPHMAIPMQMGSTAQVQQQIYVSGLPPHPLQPQGIVHPGQGLSFTAPIASQLPPQSGSLGINISTPQYPQQPGGKYVGPRKSSVRITDPKTHEEVKFDSQRMDVYTDSGSSGSRSHPNAPSHSQPLPSYTPMNYYHNSYNHTATFFPTASIPPTSGHIAPNSQAQRFNYPLTQSAQTVSFMNPSTLSSFPSNKIGSSIHGLPDPPISEHFREGSNVVSPAPPSVIHVTVKPPAAVSVGEKVSNSIPGSSVYLEKGEPHIPVGASVECNPSYSQMDSDKSLENSSQNPKYGNESMILPVTAKMSVEASISVVDGKISGNMLSPLFSSSGEPEPIILSNDGRKSEPSSRPVAFTDHKIKPDEIQVLKQTQCLQDEVTGVSKPGGARNLLDTVNRDSDSGTVDELVLSTGAFTPDASESKPSDFLTDPVSQTKLVSSQVDEQVKLEPLRNKEQGKINLFEVPNKDVKASEQFLDRNTVEALEVVSQSEKDSVLSSPATSEVPTPEAAVQPLNEPVISHSELERIATDSGLATSTTTDSIYDLHSHGDKSSILGASSCRNVNMCSDEDISTTGGQVDQLPRSSQSSALLEVKQKGEDAEIVDPSGVSLSTQASRDKTLLEMNKGKITATRSRKKRKDILQKADAAGTTSDLYMAYKGPDEKKETVYIPEGTESSSSSLDLKQFGADSVKEDIEPSEDKNEPDDWEDAADISIPELETSDDIKQMSGTLIDDKDGKGNVAKKYSKDFLLKFAEQFTELPLGFDVTPDVESLMSINRDSYPSPGKVDRPSSAGSRADRRVSGMVEDERRSRISGSFISGRDPRMDLAFTASGAIRQGVGPNFGVLRNPRAQAPQYAGGILSGPMQSVNSQGGLRNGSDADRWQRASNLQHKGLIPSPHNPLNTMHKAGKKYEVGKVSDEEEAKQRQLKAILNKLTPQNFEKLFEQVKAVNIDNAKTLTGVISQIFDKALTEPTFCEMYANFCFHLSGGLPDLSEDNEKITFKRLLLNKCQEEFERGEREQEEANKMDEEGEVKQSADEREEKRTMARRRMLGNIRLIGELYKKKMLTERIMHECIKKLLGQSQNPELSQTQDPDEEDIEALCKLMSTIGEMIDHSKAKNFMDSYFESMANLSNNMKLSSRVRFMLKDAIDLRKNKWQQRRKVEGPKKIDELHRDAAQERQAQASRLSRGPSGNALIRRGPAMEFGQRGSNIMSSPNVHAGGSRGFSNHARGYGSQDVRTEPQHSYEARTLTAHLPQRLGDDSITLGPQGGLARGMSIRAPQSMTNSSGVEVPSIPGDSKRISGSGNGYSSISERSSYSSVDDPASKHIPDRFSGSAAFDQLSAQEKNINFGNRDWKNSDLSFDGSRPTSPSVRGQGSTLRPTLSSENLLSEDCLRNKSMAAIKEYYSARDEKELLLCIKELNSPSFHPSMISLWISDSFERKDVERDLLAKLLVSLSKSSDGSLSQSQLIKGFEHVLAALEDAVSDAPRASEYMGRILARVIIENVFSLGEIGQLIYEGGEEPGYLVQIGLAANVLGNVLEAISVEKGEGVFKDMCGRSGLQLEKFRPPGPTKSRILEKFM